MKIFFLIAIILIPLIFCSCKKSEKEAMVAEGNKEANNAAEAAKNYMSHFMETNAEFFRTNNELSNGMTEFPIVVKEAITNDIFVEAAMLGNKIKQMHDQGLLPGVSKDEHGDMTVDVGNLVESNIATVLAYPTSQTYHLVVEGETSTNNYTFTKLSEKTDWKLVRAWKTDSTGQIIQEWPVK